jgi:TolB-like protein
MGGVRQQYRFGPYRLDGARGLLTQHGEPIVLGGRAFAVLHALVKARGEVVTKDELLAAAWPGTIVEEANLSVQIAALRKAFGTRPDRHSWIATVARVGYRFTAAVQLDADDEPPAGLEGEDSAGRSSIVVLPFENLSGMPEQAYFADGITEDLITALSRFRWFRVISRNASFALKGRGIGEAARKLGVRYVMEGSVRSSGPRFRITAALNDAATMSRIWADRYDFDMDEVFAVQDRIVEQVAGAMEPELLKSEGKRPPAVRREGSAGAWDLVRQGTHAFHQVTRATHLGARDLFRAAIAMETSLPDAHIWLARVNAGLVAYGWSGHVQADLEEGLAAALEAIRRDEQSPYAHYALAIVSVYAGELAQATRAAERAIALNPSFALGYLVLGMARLFDDRAAAAVEPLERGLTLNPHDPQNFVWHNLLAFARYFAGRPEHALSAAQRAWDQRPDWRPTLELIACCHLAMGHADEAGRQVDRLVRLPAPQDSILAPLRRTRSWREGIEARLTTSGSSPMQP